MQIKKLGSHIHDLLVDMEQHDPQHFVPISVSFTSMRPGNTLVFYYKDPEWGGESGFKFCMVVKNNLGKVGYTTLRGNRVVSCIKLNDMPTGVVKFIIKNFYNKRLPAHHATSYKLVSNALEAIFGRSNYHTYKLNNISQLHKLYVDKKALKFYGDEFADEFLPEDLEE